MRYDSERRNERKRRNEGVDTLGRGNFLPFCQSGQSPGLTLPIILTALTKQTLRVGYAD